MTSQTPKVFISFDMIVTVLYGDLTAAERWTQNTRI